ncbi:hypothetical protein PspLS_03068 [Pyricularia sp. CBS 133598]|nr:hypothetical protein PspLS_03068 [Pyricularia sp. CBS 133598]
MRVEHKRGMPSPIIEAKPDTGEEAAFQQCTSHVDKTGLPEVVSVDAFGAHEKTVPEEIALVKKLDRWIMPMLWAMYFLNYLDRNAIAVAKINKIDKDLGLSDRRYIPLAYQHPLSPAAIQLLFTHHQLYVSILFVGYILGTVPSNLYINRVRPGRYMAIMMMAWAAVSVVTASARTFTCLMVTRFFLGIAEAPTRWLTPEEQQLAHNRIDADITENNGSTRTLEGLKQAIKDPMVWIFMFMAHMYLAANGFKNFFPSVVNTLALDETVGLVLVCPPYLLACIATVLISWSSGHLNERTWHITVSKLVAVAGFIVAPSVESTAGRYAGMIIFCVGTYGVNSLILGWCGSVCGQTREKKSAAVGLVVDFMNASFVWSPFLWSDADRPRYAPAMAASAGVQHGHVWDRVDWEGGAQEEEWGMLRARRLRARPSVEPINGATVDPNDRLMSLQLEILDMIVGWLDDASVDRLTQTSRSLQALVGRRAWETVEVSCTNLAERRDLVWRLEPCLTGEQKRLLTANNCYRQHTVSNSVVIPGCARYVRRYIINGSDDRALYSPTFCCNWVMYTIGNFRNLRVLETSCLNQPIALKIASRPLSHALSLVNCYNLNQMPPGVTLITGLVHLCVYNVGHAKFGQDNGVTLEMLRGSATTLRSMELFHYHQSCSTASEVIMDDIDFQLTALEFLIMCRFCIREAKAMIQVVDFPSLTELHIYQPHDELCTFFDTLKTSFGAVDEPKLKALELDLVGTNYREMFDGQLSWLRSFNTLTSLRLDRWKPQGGLIVDFSPVPTAIVGHRGLRKLIFSHRDRQRIDPNFCIPVLNREWARTLAQGLPELRWLEFAPDEKDLLQTGRELSALSQLQFLRCRHKKVEKESKEENFDIAFKMFNKILKGFLREMHPGETWEGRYSLRLVQGERDDIKYDVASRLPEAWGGKRVITDTTTKREVRIRRAAEIDPAFKEEDADPVWVDKVARDLRNLLADARNAVGNDKEDVVSRRGDVVGRRRLGDEVLGRHAGGEAGVLEVHHAVAHVHAVGDVAVVVERDLDVLDRLAGQAEAHVERATTGRAGRHGGARQRHVERPQVLPAVAQVGRRVALDPELGRVRRLLAHLEDRLLDRVAAGDEDRAVLEHQRHRVVHARDVGRSGRRETLAQGLRRVVEERGESGLVGHAKALGSLVSAVDKKDGAVQEENTLNHDTSVGHGVHLPLGVRVQWLDATAGRLSRRGNVLVRSTSTDDDVGCVAILLGKRQHDGATGVGVGAVVTGKLRHLLDNGASGGTVSDIEQLRRFGSKNEQVAVVQEVNEGVHVVGLRLDEEVHGHKSARRDTVTIQHLVRRVVVRHVLRSKTVQAAGSDKDTTVGQDLGAGVPARG